MDYLRGKISYLDQGSYPHANRSFNRLKGMKVNMSAFAFLFSEIVKYTQEKVSDINEFERMLNLIGQHSGKRLLELYFWRERPLKRETRLLSLLHIAHSGFWEFAFGKAAESLERSTDNPDEYIITDNDPISNRFVSVPKELSQLNTAAWMGGVLESFLSYSGFQCTVLTHSYPDPNWSKKTVFLLKFGDPSPT